MRILVTGVRAPAAIDWAVALKRAGHAVITADCVPAYAARSSLGDLPFIRFPSPTLKPHAFHEEFPRIVRDESVELVLPSCEEVFHIARIREDLLPAKVFCSDSSLLGKLHSKLEFLDIARDVGARPPRAVRYTAVDHPTHGMPDCVLKREFSRFGCTTVVAPSRGRLARLDTESGNPWIIQERIAGQEFCTFSIAVGGRLTAHAAYMPRHRLGGSSSFFFEPVQHGEIEKFVGAFVARTKFHGQIGFDIIEREDGSLAPLDCNPRATSGVHLFGADPRLAEAILGTTAGAIRPVDHSPRMLPLAMSLFGAPAAFISGGIRGFLSDRRAALHAPVQRPSVGSEFADLAFYLGRCVTRGVSLAGATTVDIEWNGGS